MTKVNSILHGEINFFPYQCETPVGESLQWSTDLIKAHDGTEERYNNRSMPRRSFRYKFPLSQFKTMEAFNSMYGALREDWAFPLWSEAQFVGNIIGGSVSILCEVEDYSFKANSLGFLFNSNGYQVIDVSGFIYEDESNISGIAVLGTGLEPMSYAYLMPAKLGFISNDVKKSTNGLESTMDIEFITQEDSTIVVPTPPQYKGKDFYYNTSLKSGLRLSRNLTMKQDIIDFNLGFIENRTPWVDNNYTSPFKVILENSAEVLEYKQFLYRCAGKYRGFWLPSSESDFNVLSTGLITDTIVVSSDSIINYTTNRVNILIKTVDGFDYFKEIDSFLQIDDNRVALTLTSDLNLDALDIAYISYFGYYRLDNDQIKLNWLGNGVVESKIKVLELSP